MNPAHVEVGESLRTVVLVNVVQVVEATKIDRQCVVSRAAYQIQI